MIPWDLGFLKTVLATVGRMIWREERGEKERAVQSYFMAELEGDCGLDQ